MEPENEIVTTEPTTVKTIVSSGSAPSSTANTTIVDATTGDRIVIIPMAEWKQCLQRGFRTFLQAATFLLGGGTVASFSSGIGIPPASVAGLPSSGNPFVDGILYAAFFGCLVACWNAAEFALDIDIHAPGFRA